MRQIFIRFFLFAVLFVAAVDCASVFARGGGGCLAAGTEVMTPNGSVAIESLKVSQAVCTVNSAGLRSAVVTGVSRVDPVEFVRIELPDETIDATAEHPFEVAPGTFIAAARLRVGGTVVRWYGSRLFDSPIVGIQHVVADRPAYNLTVMPGETFLADGVVVHNKGCFLPDTPVLKSDGTSASISNIRAGDTVMAFDADLRLVPASVLEVVSIDVDGYLQITTDRVTLSVTDEHPFFVGNGTFKSADALRSGDRVYAFDGRGLVPQIIRSIKPVVGRVKVYNLRTDEPHTYFASGIAVHNKGGGGGGGHGGGGFGGFGGAHSGFGGSGGSSDFNDFCAMVGFFSLIAFIIFAVVTALKGHGQFGSDRTGVELDYIHPMRVIQPKAETTLRLLETLAQSDRSFDPDQLRMLSSKVFRQLQKCWQSQAYEPMRPLLTPSLFAQHQVQLQAMKDHHEINCIDDLIVDSVILIHVHVDPAHGNPDFTALITATARDYYIDDRSRKFLRGDRTPARFQEFWTFGKSDHGWVLRRIEQSRESTKLTEPNIVKGSPASEPPIDADADAAPTRVDMLLADWARVDSMWNRGLMIDRVSAVFTEFTMAGQGSGAPFPAGDIGPVLVRQMQAIMDRNRQQNLRTEVRNFDVRHVDIVAVRKDAEPSNCQFLARVSVHAQTIMMRSGKIIQKDPDVRAFTRHCLFGRSDGVWQLQKLLTPEQADTYAASGNVNRLPA